MINEEKINLNYTRWVTRLKKYNCYSDLMINELGEKIKNASFALIENSGAAYQGSMLNVVINNLCLIAHHLNENAFGEDSKQKKLHPYLQANNYMLMRVLLLQHIAKAEMFVIQENQWKQKNGYIYDFNPDLDTCMKCGERSIYLCMKYGIQLSEEEYEAMRIIDKEEMSVTQYISPLCQIVKMANQLVSIELHRTFLDKN